MGIINNLLELGFNEASIIIYLLLLSKIIGIIMGSRGSSTSCQG